MSCELRQIGLVVFAIMNELIHATTAELEAGLEFIRCSPKDGGTLEMIVRRPVVDERESVAEVALDLAAGLAGDNWKQRGSARTPDGSANPEMQITVMNSRAAAVVALSRERWGLAGDQLFVDLDLSCENLPPGTRLAVGSAIIEATGPPHTGCKKFLARFGAAALEFVNSPLGKQLHLRGINARVVQSGVIRVGDLVKKT
jgi:hypothetical protein